MSVRRPVSAVSMMFCVLVGALALGGAPALAASKGVVGFFGGSGTAGGLFNAPGGVAVNDTSGNVYVVDSGNNRVQELSAGGAFIRAWGLGVVSSGQDSGGTSTVERVVVAGTSGTFTLSFAGQTTGAIAWDAPAGLVEADLDGLSTIGGVGGSVTVSGEGTSGKPYEVTFGGSLRGAAVAQMTVDTSGLGVAVGVSLSCVAGPNSPPSTKTFQWLRNGVAIAGAVSSTYTTVAGDEGGVVQCQVFAIDANAGSTQVSAARAVVSPAPGTVPPVAPGSIEKPTVTAGALTVGGPGGAMLSCAAGAWTGASSFSYQWYRNGVALSGDGANTSVYTVQSADLATAAAFQCAVTGIDVGGSVTRVSSSVTTAAAPKELVVATATATVPVLATVSTTVTGAPGFEVCNAASSPQDVCKAAVAGSVAGAMSAPEGVAVEQVTGDVYVTDQGNRRVDEFTEAGVFVRAFAWGVETGASKPQVCTTTCEAGLSGAGAGEFGATIGYPAVDPTTGDVYVADPANMRVQVFEGDGVFVHAFGWGVTNGASEFQVCTSTCQAGVVSASEIDLGRFAAGSPTGVAVDALGDVYVVDGGSPDYRVQKFGAVSKENTPLAEFFASAQLTGTSSVTAPSDIAVEPALGGSVLAAREPSSPPEHLVYELGSGGSLLGTYAEGAALPVPQGLAVGSSSGAGVYFSTATGNRVFALGTIVAPSATIEAVTSPTASEATLHGTIDPEETPPNGIETTWQFEYSTNNVDWAPLPGGKLAASTSPVAVTQTLTGLEGGTVYDVRLHASKEFAAGSTTSTTVQFTTSTAAPMISGEAVTKIASTSATLSAQINPQHLDTSYHFEYDTVPYTTSTMHGTSLPVPDGDIGEGVSVVPVSQEPRDLKPDTTYHYRLVAANSAETTDGPEHAFTTQPRGEALVLPDGRQWEMVSPPNKNGALLGAIGGIAEGGVVQAAADGGAFTWIANAAIGSEPAGNLSLQWSQVFSARGAGGWSSRDIEPPHAAATGYVGGDGTEYKFFSSDLSLGLVEAKGETPLSPEATEKTIYLREDTGDSYLPLVTAANVPEGVKFGGHLFGDTVEGAPTFYGASPDLSHVVFSAEAGLDGSYPGAKGLYEWIGGRLHLVSVLPDGEPATGESSLGYVNGRVTHAISNDGSRVIWENASGLYMRDIVKGETVPLGAGGRFQAASDNDHRVFFTAGGDLYVFETTNSEDEALTGTLIDLTVDHNVGESASVQGTLPGASEDGSYVYLVARGVLGGTENAGHEKAAAGADNLYVLHDTGAGWSTTFVAQLSSEDGTGDWNIRGETAGVSDLSDMTSRVSPDGRYLAFMSDRELTGYDNHDANSGAADEEVFLYDASTERLVCASCDPTGARPVGVFDQLPPGEIKVFPIFDAARVWEGRWVAANIPGWTPRSQGGDSGFYASYQSRYLSDSGRLFFNSSDALVPQDVDGTQDVYEFEPSEVGSCASASSTFDVARDGCVSLISSGESSGESAFLDASESGGDVFFLTAAKLAPQDYDADLDVYDAHECTAGTPCVSSPVSSPACTTADACRVAPTPQPPIFGSPSSTTFSGRGNPVPSPSVVVKAKAKPLTRAQKLAEALKVCRRKPKKKRPACERQARKRYGALKAKKTSKGGK